MPFSEIIGHRALLSLISHAVARESLPPSLIFAGPDGVGKRHVALAVAAALNCQAPLQSTSETEIADPNQTKRGSSRLEDFTIEADSCAQCNACRRIARGVHADVIMIEPSANGNIVIDQVRGAVDSATYRPFEGHRRVVIIDEADLLLVEAQNALLKTLEEPPPASVFFLVSSRPDMLIPTVRSRCQRLRFGRLSEAEVSTLLMEVHGYTELDAHAAAATAGGSVGKVLKEGSADFSTARDVARRVLQTVSESPGAKQRLTSAKELTKGSTGSRLAADRENLALRLRALGSLLRDLQVLLTGADENILANADLKQGLVVLGKAFNGDRIGNAFSAVDQALEALVERNASPKIVADWLVCQL